MRLRVRTQPTPTPKVNFSVRQRGSSEPPSPSFKIKLPFIKEAKGMSWAQVAQVASSFRHRPHRSRPWWALSVLRCQGSTDRGPCVLLSWALCSPRLTTCRSASVTNLSLTPRHPRACRNRGRGKGSEPGHHRQELPPSGHCWRLFLEHQSSPRSTSSICLLSPAQSAPTWPVATPLYPCYFSPVLRRAAHPPWEISGFL